MARATLLENSLLSEAVHGRPRVCRAVERMLAQMLEVPVEECYERSDRPRCCFKIDGSSVCLRLTTLDDPQTISVPLRVSRLASAREGAARAEQRSCPYPRTGRASPDA